MAITADENLNNASRLAAINQRVWRQIQLEKAYKVAYLEHCGYSIAIPQSTVSAMVAEFGVLRTEIKTLEDAINGGG